MIAQDERERSGIDFFDDDAERQMIANMVGFVCQLVRLDS